MGYGDAVAETARLTASRAELTEDETLELNANLNRLLDSLDEQQQISVTYFVPDEKKSGGKYVEKLGVVRIYDSYANELVFTDGVRIAVADMARLELTIKHKFGKNAVLKGTNFTEGAMAKERNRQIGGHKA